MLTLSSIGATAEPDWEQWFIEFEGRLVRELLGIQRDSWLEQLELQCNADVDPIFARALADASSHPELASDRQYELIRDLMSLERREKHQVRVYFDRLAEIQRGRRSVLHLYLNMDELARHYHEHTFARRNLGSSCIPC